MKLPKIYFEKVDNIFKDPDYDDRIFADNNNQEYIVSFPIKQVFTFRSQYPVRLSPAETKDIIQFEREMARQRLVTEASKSYPNAIFRFIEKEPIKDAYIPEIFVLETKLIAYNMDFCTYEESSKYAEEVLI